MKNCYRENFPSKFFKKFIANIHLVNKTVPTVEKKPILLVFLYIGSASLQSRTKLKKSLKNVLSCCKLQILFKNKTGVGKTFHFKDRILKDNTSGAIYKFQCVRVLVYIYLSKAS